MLRHHFVTASVTLLLLGFIAAGPAIGQIDHRVNMGNATTAGRANDANPGIGTSGLNQPVQRFDAGGYSNAIISGNVTGLAGFQGYSPIPQANQFRAPLPSGYLSSFRATTVGVEDVTSNRVLGQNRYYDVQQTVSDVGFIRSGLNAPGSSMLASPNVVPPSPAVPPPGVGLRPIPLMTDLRIDQQYNRSVLVGLLQQTQAAPPAVVQPPGPGPRDWRYKSAAASSIFGVPTLTSLEQSRASEGLLPGVFPSGEEEGAEAAGAAEGVGLQPVAAPGPGGGQPAVGGPGTRINNMPSEAGPGAPISGLRGSGGLQTQGGLPPGRLGEDRFTDLLRAVQTAQQMGVKKLGFEAVRQGGEGEAEQGQGTAAAPELTPPKHRSLLRRPPSSGLAELATAAKWASDLLESPMKSFAGRYQDQMNGYLRDGEEALRKGEYYRAAGFFDLANTVDPTNPLPLLHRGHALLAAGDYVSAATSLERGIARFPQIAAFQIDLPALGGSIYDVRRADLEKKLATSDQYELRFLLGYLELYSGLPEEGIRDLEQAAKAAPPDSIVSVFADLVTSRKELPALPELQGMGEPGQ